MDETSLTTEVNSPRRQTGRMLMAVILGLGIWNLIVSLMTNVVVPWLGAVMGQDANLPASFTRNYDYPDLFVALLEFAVAGIVAISINWAFQRPQRRRMARAVQPVDSTSIVPPVQPAVVSPVTVQPMAPPQPIAPQPARVVAQTVLAAPEPARISATPVAPVAAVPVPPPVVQPAIGVSSTAAAPKPAPTPTVQQTPPSPTTAVAPTKPADPAKAKSEPAKPKKEKPVYYNLVGEPVASDED